MPARLKNRDVTEYYIQQVLKELGLHKLRTFPMKIEMRKKLALHCQGLCEGTKKEVIITIATHCPDTGRKMTYIEMMKTLTHELIHAKQFIRGQLSGDGVWKWKGRNADNYKYDNQPWEKEAYRREDQIFLKCFPFHMEFNQ